MTANARGTSPRQASLLSANVSLIFDGGSLGNPGKGYGSFIARGAVQTAVPERREYAGRRTNNEAEYMTMIEGLRFILNEAQITGQAPGSLSIDVRSDSKLVVEQVSGRWKVKNEGLRPLHAEARELLARFGNWQLTWHPRSESVRYLGH
ncbi:MAG: reverse transcriptase-like protein [Thermomicrobiales bacterium]|nr:reverse transcriptase-like protein [Thermomicrobiales bacterium]